MKKCVPYYIFLSLLISCTTDREIKPTCIDPNSVLIHYWNFNNTSGTQTSIQPDFTLLSPTTSSITYAGTGAGYMDSFTPGYDLNSRNSDVAGNGIRARNPSNTRSLLITTPTTGFKNIVLRFATAKSGTGAPQQNYSYTIDGTNYLSAGLNVTTFNPETDPLNSIVCLDFSDISTVNNNANFKLKIDFAGDTATGLTGNNRFDNITVEGDSLPPSNLTYPSPNIYTINTAIPNLIPTISGSVTSYSVSPSLPSGLVLNAVTGVISGTPIALSSATSYLVTASNGSGNTTFSISIAVGTLPIDTTLYLIHYWNFNSLAAGTLTSVASDNSLITPNTTSITYAGTGAGFMDQVSPGSLINSQNGIIDGLGLRVRNPSDTRSLIISASTLGYKNIVVKFATVRSSSAGASIQNYSYTIDGTNYITTGLGTTTYSPDLDPLYTVVTLDFSGISSVVNNPNFKVKIDFAGPSASGTTGNNRFDNLTFQGNVL